MQESICYTKIYKYPVKLYSFTINRQKITISKKGIELRRIIFTAVFAIFLNIFLKNVVSALIPPMFRLIVYLGVPFFLSYFLIKKKEGKNLSFYIKDFVCYKLFLSRAKYVVANTKRIQDTYRVDGTLLQGNVQYERRIAG